MTVNQITLRVVEALEAADIPYMLVGSYSSNAYGISRSTQDADFVIELVDKSLTAIVAPLVDILDIDPQLRLEMVTGTYRYVGRARETPFKIELFLTSADPHDRSRFQRRARQPFLYKTAVLPTPEDVIIQKLRWFKLAKRAKDLEDARNVTAVQRDHLDYAYIRSWCDQHDTRELFETLYEESKQFEP